MTFNFNSSHDLDVRIEAGERQGLPLVTVPVPPLLAQTTDNIAQQRRRQPQIPLLRCCSLPETLLLLLRYSRLPETHGRYGTAAAMAAMLYSLHLVSCSPCFQPPAEAANVSVLSCGEACMV